MAISRLPWLTALAAWGTAGTWTRGLHFVPDPSERGVDAPDHGMLRYDLLGAGLAVTRPATYAVERRRGWAEAEGSPPRDERDVWDERRARELRMVKPRPGDAGVRLEVTGGYAAFRSRGYSREVAYTIESPAGRLALPRVQWADWSRAGDLLVATVAGELQVRTAADWLGAAATVADLREESPAPAPAPAQLRDWPRA